jgi:RecG-like helicase
MAMAQAEQTQPGEGSGLLQRITSRLVKSEQELEATELQADTDRLGGTPIADLVDRQTASVCGSVRSVTLRPRVTVPALVVELYDGSKMLNLVWLGRREIRGIEPGTYLTVRGRVTYQRGVPTIFNPAYDIKPARGH